MTLLVTASFVVASPDSRRTISLNGQWEVAESSLNEIPTQFNHQVPVPGLIDMARPVFVDVGGKSKKREAFWYRRFFLIKGQIPAVALLKFQKAKYGIQVFLNGHLLGGSYSSFVPNTFDVRKYLNGSEESNTLLVRVGADVAAVPDTIPQGKDFEKKRYLPGIYDDVDLILSGTPHIVNVQIVPDVAARSARVVVLIHNTGETKSVQLSSKISEESTGRVAGTAVSAPVFLNSNEDHTFELVIPVQACRLWSPEEPFLYELAVSTGTDELTTTFGMRSFRFDPESGRALLNDKPYFMRGTNVAIYRFFEDPERGDKPWREEWIRRLLGKFKQMNWNTIRFHMSFPPEKWYRIADEEGFLVHDEYPIWTKSDVLRSDILVEEYTKWMRERWNHPCVVLWDAQNETVSQATGKALQEVRHLDLSNRPWDNGWSEPQSENDSIEAHPYLHTMIPDFHYSFEKPGRKNAPYVESLIKLLRRARVPRNGPNERSGAKVTFDNPIIINEYGWLWLNRDGTPTTLSEKIYAHELGPNAAIEKRRLFHARHMAQLTEYWRGHRQCAGVLHSFGLSYSHPHEPRGQTSDDLVDVERIRFEPLFEKYMKNAFAPVGLMIDRWEQEYQTGSEIDIPIYVTNDLYENWQGTLRLSLVRYDEVLTTQQTDCSVQGLGQTIISLRNTIPVATGSYQFVAELVANETGESVTMSLRDFQAVANSAQD